MSSEKWVLYFNSQHECERFIKALSHCWSTYFQVLQNCTKIVDLENKDTDKLSELE